MRKFLVLLAACIMFHPGCKKDDPIPPGPVPSITSVSPNEGTIGTEITISGNNFAPDAVVIVGDKISTNVEVASNTLIYARIPSGIPGNTLLPVTVENPAGGNATLKDSFKAVDPKLSFINSATRPSGNIGSTVILEGTAFGDTQGEGKVLFSDGDGGTVPATISADDDWTNEFIITTVPNGAGDGPVVVTTEIGTSNEIDFQITSAATFSPSTINWTVTTPLPHGISGHKGLFVPVENASGGTDQYVFVMGGRNNDAAATVNTFRGLINMDGTISAWENSADLPEPLSFHNVVAATPFNSRADGSGYLYLMGGINSDGKAVSTVSVAALNDDGTIANWSATTPLPHGIHSFGAVIFRSTIYIAGGADSNHKPLSSVYKAKINEDGQLGEWEELPELPDAVAYHGFVSFGGYLYVAGGENGISDPDAGSQVSPSKRIYYSRINLRTGDINDWNANPSEPGKERSKHTTLILGGNLFISSGLYSGLNPNVPGSSENVYASISSDGSIGTFNGATGSNTLFSAGGSNLFNQSGISYIDKDGVAHVMIIGGAKVGSPGNKSEKVLFY